MNSERPGRAVIGPAGQPLTANNLPSPETKRWVMSRKADVIAAVRRGLIGRNDACDRYGISDEELRSWERMIDAHGLRGLQTTRLQQYRGSSSRITDSQDGLDPKTDEQRNDGYRTLGGLGGTFEDLGSRAKQPEIRPRLNGFLRNEDGIMAVVFALLLPVFLVIAALTIDMGYAYQKRNMVQVDASVSSLAGAGIAMDNATVTRSEIWSFDTIDKDGDGVPDNDDSDGDGVIDGAVILNEALAYAERNMPGEAVLAAVDVMPGNWDPATRTFTRAGNWDPITLSFTTDPATYDADAMTFTSVGAALAPLNAVLAITRRSDTGANNNPLPLFLAAAVGLPEVNINTAAIATVVPTIGDPLACILALDMDDAAALHIFGGAELIALECDIQVNSCADNATWFHGNPDIHIALEGQPGGTISMCGSYRENGPVTVVGDMNYSNPSNYQSDNTILAAPVVSGCDFVDFTWKAGDPPIYPGVYCGGIKVTSSGGTMIFCGQEPTADCAGGVATEDGLYIMKDGPLEIAGGSGVVGRGVTFYLTDGPGGPYSLVDFKGTSNTSLDLKASIWGDYTGVLFWHDCGDTAEVCNGLTHNLRGTPDYGMEGLLYFPDSDLYIRGTSDATGGSNDCLMIVANTIEFNGTTGAQVNNACSNYNGFNDLFAADLTLRLVH